MLAASSRKLLRARGGRKATLASVLQPLARSRFPRQVRELRTQTKPPRLSGSLQGLALLLAAIQTSGQPRRIWAAQRVQSLRQTHSDRALASYPRDQQVPPALRDQRRRHEPPNTKKASVLLA